MERDRVERFQKVIRENSPFPTAAEYLQECITDFENGWRSFKLYCVKIKLMAYCHDRTQTEEEKQRLCELAERYVRCARKAPHTSWFLLTSMIWCWKNPAYLAYYPCGDRIFQYMAERKADVNARAPWGETILHLIVKQSQVPQAERSSLLKVLLENGAHPDYRDHLGSTPIDFATTPEEICLLRKYHSLQCLAIEVIINENIYCNSETLGPAKMTFTDHQRFRS